MYQTRFHWPTALKSEILRLRYSVFAALLAIAVINLPLSAAETTTRGAAAKDDIFARTNLVAWCIVPFDAKKRSPEDRAEMLSRLGFSKFAYDYRAEHIPTFDAEMVALKRHQIELTAWWFPQQLNDEARGILDVLKRHDIKTQLWVMGGGDATNTETERVERVKTEAARIRPIAEEAAKIGCRVGLYNHGGWFGEPENQIAIIEAINLPNVGIVYNLHHGHEHLDAVSGAAKTHAAASLRAESQWHVARRRAAWAVDCAAWPRRSRPRFT